MLLYLGLKGFIDTNILTLKRVRRELSKLKTGKITMVILIGLMCMALTAIIYIQFRTVEEGDLSALGHLRDEELRTETGHLRARTEEVMGQVSNVNNLINEYQAHVDAGLEASELFNRELQTAKNLVGATDISGSGVIITLEGSAIAEITPTDLMNLVNELRLAGAEAIAINDVRIVHNSYVAYRTGRHISVSGMIVRAPFTVTAIGNSTHLYSGISQRQHGFRDRLALDGKTVTVEVSDNVHISGYARELRFEHVREGR